MGRREEDVSGGPCEVEGCPKPCIQGGYCAGHTDAWTESPEHDWVVAILATMGERLEVEGGGEIALMAIAAGRAQFAKKAAAR